MKLLLPDIANRMDVRPFKRLIMWHGDLDAIVAAHQDTILGPAEFGDADCQPYADRQQRHGEGEGRYIRQHPLPIIVGFFRNALIARQVVGNLEPANKGRAIGWLGEGRSGARPKLEHAVLFFRRGRYDGSLGSHGCQLRGNSVFFSTTAFQLEVKTGNCRRVVHSSEVSWNLP
jgi:hypothetical protein